MRPACYNMRVNNAERSLHKSAMLQRLGSCAVAMRKMEKVIRYKCAWCGGEFHTPNLHCCKWDPSCKNCLSCAHRGEFVKGEPARQTGFGEFEEGKPNAFRCAVKDYVQLGGWNDFPQAATAIPQYNTRGKVCHCPDHKTIRGYLGKETFKDIEEKRRLAAVKKRREECVQEARKEPSRKAAKAELAEEIDFL